MLSHDTENHRIIYQYDFEKVFIEPWGPNALRIRATHQPELPSNQDWALSSSPPDSPTSNKTTINIESDTTGGTITNGKITANISPRGKIIIRNAQTGQLLLEEYMRNRNDQLDPKCSALLVEAREFKPRAGRDDYHLTMRLESVERDEKIYGMGQYQQPYLDLKGLDLELAQRNSQASVPFAVSSLGYGLLWNNPGVGRAVLGKNIMSFEAYSTRVLDYWIVAGDSPKEIVEAYADVTGKVPMMPEYGLGFWQCKLRYQTQEELLSVAREYRRRKLPIDLIVIDYFHWPLQGEWKFDPTYWPDPDAMIKELNELKIELMVSIWPTVDIKSENYEEMLAKGYLIRTDRGIRTAMNFQGETVHFDATNPGSRKYVWEKARQNYYSKGIKVFWLDEAEPEYSAYDFDNYRYHLGSNVTIGNIYPREYARAFYEGQTEAGQKNIVNLLRCAWAGSQKYGALVWSGDIASSWESLRCQLAAGLNMGMAGIPWWTTDIGGFHGGDPTKESFRELLVRWFQWGAFCPVMRLHGDREPRQPQHGTTGGATCLSGAENEVWSYGEEVYAICKKYLKIREQLRDYTRELMKEAHEKGTPVMRPLFLEFPQDKTAWEVEDQYMYGSKYLCAPILYPGQKKRSVYLPEGEWHYYADGSMGTGEIGRKSSQGYRFQLEKGQWREFDCPIEIMPVFIRV
ncbi:glycosyl hydrolase, putative [Talaromyces stipitatus ATCC 10500]|uniref:Glycosyl hydrolase, putative n=1 Tax=Talaromyces stipitatus (strain ATCC 10500 / CBS 375.48 / QM 6759 / NRRL 1006) TaxID=441959 RepID=B8MCI2_TALSN|nr:glycosyl hydrolase, putative [Talaromyces stipitatus ATCC 10500]EED18798.1 glycosyl hydrolase, putative [Talaromyces stipitatus ATCC 10500]